MSDFQVTPLSPAPLVPEKPAPVFWFTYKNQIILGVVAALAIVSSVSYFLGRKSFSESRVDFAIEGPTEISSGELVTYKLTYQNNNQIGLKDLKLLFLYPAEAVVVADGNIVTTVNETIDIPELASGESGERIFTAYLVGDRGSIRTAKATLTFVPLNVSSVFKKQISLSSTITTLAIPLTLVAPPSVINGQTITYLIDYRNQSQQDYADLRLKVRYPDGFKFSSATPAAKSGQNSWDIARLKQGAGARISIQGTLQGTERETKTINLTLQKKITTPAGEVYVDFEKAEAVSVIASPYLLIDLDVNDSKTYSAHLGDDLDYLISVKNNSPADITSLNLTAVLEGGMFDFTTVKSGGAFDSRTNTLTWNSSALPELALLRPGQRAQATFSVRLKNSFSGGSGSANSLVKVSAHLETDNIPAGLDTDRLAVSDQLITRISSEPNFNQRILITDSQFGLASPWPPKVNVKSTFSVHWTLINPANALTSAKVTAQLASGVKWENQTRVSGAAIAPVFDSRLNTVTWNIGTLPAGTGITTVKYEGAFLISITPSSNQVGQDPLLLKNVKFEGTDSFTQEKISRTVQDSTTLSIADSEADGRVQP